MNVLQSGTFTKARIISALKNQRAADLDTNSAAYKAWIHRMVDSLGVASADSIRDYVVLPFANIGSAIYPHQSADTSSRKCYLAYAGSVYKRSAPIPALPGTVAARYGGWRATVNVSSSDSTWSFNGAFDLSIYSGGAHIANGDVLFLRFVPLDSRSVDKLLILYRLAGNEKPYYLGNAGGFYGDEIGQLVIPAINFPQNTSTPVDIIVTLSFYGKHAI